MMGAKAVDGAVHFGGRSPARLLIGGNWYRRSIANASLRGGVTSVERIQLTLKKQVLVLLLN